MASIQRRGRGSRAITTATHEPARRPATPSRNAHWDQEPLLDKDALVAFAAEATAALRRESSALAKLRRPSPFFAILCSLLSDVEERLENAASVTESKVSELLATLERLAKWPKPFKAPTRPFDRNAYSRLIHILGDSSQLARSCIKTLAEDPRAVNDRQKFQKAFKAFANVKLGPRGPKLSELTRSSAESESNSNSATAQCLQKLYWTLCQLCRCSLAVGGGGFKANVVVDYEARPAVADDGVIIESFFLHRHHTGNNETGEWKETRIQVLLDQYDIEDSDNTKTRVLRSARGDKKISDFCKLLQSQELGCLKLRASSGGLFDDGIELSRDGISLQAPSVSLARVLASASLNKDSQRKLLLSYLLAKAVWQFYDSDWIAEAWSKQEVQFMQQRIDKLQNKVLLNYRPFISAEFRDDAPPQGAPSLEGYGVVAKTPKGTHIFPKILALGITLLEIELGEGIENRYAREFLDADGRPRANAAHMTAGDFITSDKWKAQKKVYLPVRQAIEICVKPDTGQLGTDPARVRENLHRCVVAPLGALFGMAYDCDGCPEKFDPGPMNFESSDEPCDDIYSVPGSAHMRETSGSPNSPSAQQLVVEYPTILPVITAKLYEVQEPEKPVESARDCELFGNENQEPPDPRKYEQTEKWVYTFKRLRTEHKIGVGPVNRIKVAILDTGIDIKHPNIYLERRRILKHESFIDGDATVDASGHGTHIAGIVLDLTTNVDLCIAKFVDSRRYGDSEKEAVGQRIVKALQRARLDWKVNMISLSFGFSKVGPNDPIQKEIEKCLNDNIVVFASASNDGGNRPRTYPGNYHRVLCIHSATGVGDGSSFSPTPETDARDHNFSAVGECVKSCWPVKEPLTADKYKHMSGTSFATPVAVSIAAFMVGYIQRKMPNYDWNVEPLSPEGIQIIFRMMSRGNKRDGYDWISPQWFFTKNIEGKIQQDLIQELRGYPKATDAKSMETK